MPLNVLLVDDNRDVMNWGCRSTSISLSQLLRKSFEVNDSIDKKTADSQIPIGRIPLSYDLIQRMHISIPYNLIISRVRVPFLSRLFIDKLDVVVEDPKESAKMVLKHRRHNRILDSICEKIDQSDLVVINGEGSMIFTNPPRRDLLFQLMIIQLATMHFSKPTYYVNSMVSDCPVSGRNEKLVRMCTESLSHCSGVSVRDPLSLRILRSTAPDIKCSFIPDALFTWASYFDKLTSVPPNNGDFIIPFPELDKYLGKLDLSGQYICIAASSLAARYPEEAVLCYTNLVERIKSLGMKTYIVETCGGEHFLNNVSELTHTPIVPGHISIMMGGAILANASLFISGRWHPSIMASLGGTPCVFLAANSHKTMSLQEVLEYDKQKVFSALPSNEDCEQILSLAEDLLNNRETLRPHILEIVKKRSIEATAVLDLMHI